MIFHFMLQSVQQQEAEAGKTGLMPKRVEVHFLKNPGSDNPDRIRTKQTACEHGMLNSGNRISFIDILPFNGDPS